MELQEIIKKIDNKEELSEEEIETLLWEAEEIYQEEGENRRWTRSMFTVVRVDNRNFAIIWEQGLTEYQEDGFYEQPYEVGCETELKTITKQIWKPIEEVKNENKSLIIVKQLPLIEEHLKELSTEIEQKVESAKSLICNEESVKTVKQIRAELNKEFKEIEQQRKNVKEQVLTPYMQFEEVYKKYISDKYKSADLDLKQKIDNVENELRTKKEKEIQDYFEEYKQSLKIDFIKYEDAKIKTGLSDSLTSLKKQAKEFIDKVNTDLATIMLQENKEELLVEYKSNGLILNNALTVVANRHKQLQEEREKQQREKETQECIVSVAQEESYTENSEILQAPVAQEKEEILTLRFTVKGTRAKLKELKKFLEDGGYDYE